jgi:hypothetical protein
MKTPLIDLDVNSLYWNIGIDKTNPCGEIFFDFIPKYKKEEMLKGIKKLERKIENITRNGGNNAVILTKRWQEKIFKLEEELLTNV